MVGPKHHKNQPGRIKPANDGLNQVPMELSSAQREAVTYGEGPLLVGAGAGSGKTRTLTQRVIHLIKQGVSPGRILAITFTNKAADEIKRRIYTELPPELTVSLPVLGTFHSFGARILREESKKLGRTPDFTIFDGNDSSQFLKKVLKRLDFSPTLHPPAKVSRKISRIKTDRTDLESLDEEDRLIFETYERGLKDQNAFDFDDLIEKPVHLFEGSETTLEKHRSRYSYVLVDEFQDVNSAEYRLVKLLSSKHRNLNVVGDDNQSIYGFRGADFKTFLNFEEDWPEAKVVNLGENFRSSGAIVRASYGVIKNNKFQRPKELSTPNDVGTAVKIFAAVNPEEEAEILVREVFKLTRATGPSAISNSAILYRTNAQSRALESALSLAGISYDIYGGLKFYERKEVRDIVSAIRYATNPRDEVSLERLKKTFRKAVAQELENELPQFGKELALMELIGFFMKTTDYPRHLVEKFDNSEERLENVKELLNFAATFQSTSDFLERIALLQDADRPARGTPGKSIKMMTIHLAKGLEFDRVFLVGATEGVLPHQRSLQTLEELEEERRLMYVAMTRARKELIISFYGLASRFLYEIPPELVEFESSRRAEDDGETYISY